VSEPTPRREQDDAYSTAFDATILEHGQWGDQPAVRLEQSWFYPEGGGQLGDRGQLGESTVLDVQVDDAGVVWHVVDRLPPLGAAAARIDWARRFDHMQQHTGQHVLSAALERELSAPTLSSTLGAERSVIEVDLSEVDWPTLARVEAVANRVLWDDRELVQHWTDAAGVQRFPLRKPPQVTGRIRVIEIPEWDWSACGGTHTRRTGEVGAVKIVGWERVRGHLRFTFLCGRRALADHAWRTESLTEAARRHTLKDRDLLAHLERAAEERDVLRRRVAELERAALADAVRREVGDPPGPLLRVADLASREEARLAAVLAIEAGAPWAVSASAGPQPVVVVACAPTSGLDLRAMLPRLLETCDGKGGGSPTLLTVAAATGDAARAGHAHAVAWIADSGGRAPTH